MRRKCRQAARGKTCRGKVGYESEEEAAGAAISRLSKEGCDTAILRIYRCPACKLFHLTSRASLPRRQNPAIDARPEA